LGLTAVFYAFWLTFIGPRGLPFLGSLPFISSWHPSKLVFKGLDQLHKIHGLILGFRIGPQLVVSIAGYEACKEALQIATLEGRPDNAPARMKSKGNRRGARSLSKKLQY